MSNVITYKLILVRHYHIMSPSYFEFGSTTRFEVIRHWEKFFEAAGYKLMNQYFIEEENGKIKHLYYGKDISSWNQ